ncbi:hypothetical protein ACIO3R_30510 [Streptomyces sp. NPDC087428]|uniref:hypothetical protein n=1 Tax=Streptomyces sp. NPDC087428 TaxID=3365788 RepID=UPI0038163676
MDLPAHPVHALRHDIVDVHRPSLAVPQTASRHHDDLVLRAVSGLLALLAERVPDTDQVRLRAAGRLGTAAVLEEGPHAAGELSGHVTHHPFQPKNHAQAPH